MSDAGVHNQTTQGGLLRGLFSWHNAHHLLMAAVIASCTLLVEISGSLDWLDAVTLRLASSYNSQDASNSKTDISASTAAELPTTLLINDQIFESYFLQSSPLRREKLALLINRISEQHPKLLAIDIDLAPGADDPLGNSPAQVKLDRQLDSSARGLCATADSHGEGRCKIVLTLPMPVASEPLKQLQFDWIKARCAAGIEFASASLLSHQGTIIRQSANTPNLGNVSAWWFKQDAVEHAPQHAHSEHPSYDYFCKSAAQYQSGKDFFSLVNLDAIANGDGKTVPLNTHYFSLAADDDIQLQKDVKGVEPLIPAIPNASQRAIFLGGSYGVTDKFDTALGKFDGVSIHAASFYGNLNGVANASHVFAWGLDILIGLFLGILFQALWEKYNEAADRQKASEPISLSTRAVQYLVAKLWLLGIFALLALLAMIFLYSASTLLSHGLWLNPGPIVIGMFLDSLLSSRSKHHAAHIDGFQSLLKQHPDMLWQFVLVGYVLYILLIATHH